jgi:hypothetical protein
MGAMSTAMSNEEPMATVTIRIPAALRELAGGAEELDVRADSVRDALERLGEEHRLLVQRILTRAGELRPYVNLFLDDSDVRLLQGLDTPVQPRQTLIVMPSVAGG